MDKSLRKEMNRAILYKEWIKLKWPTILVASVFLCVVSYIFVEINHSFRTLGSVSLWDMIVHKDYRMISTFMYLPLIAGFVLGIAQFVPEMQKRRLKLTLHLPMNENRIIFRMLTIGLTILAALFVVTIGLFTVGLQVLFAPEIVSAWIEASLPWFAAGLAAYLLIAWIAIEPTWKQRIFNSILAFPLLQLFLLGGSSFGYHYFSPFLFLLSILLLATVYRSVVRFKEGVQ